jgi:hypothetical protein
VIEMADGNEKADEKKALVLDEQGLLLFHLKELTKNRSDIGIRETVNPSQTAIDRATQTIEDKDKDAGLSSICLVDTKTPSKFMNLLKGDPKKNDILLRMSTFELSSLVPTIRLYKIFLNPITDKEIILEIPFETRATGIDDIYRSGLGLGTGAGLTSVNWKHNPKNEANMNSYRVNMNIHLQNIQEFMKSRNSVLTEDGTILDVAIQDLLYQRKDWRKETGQGTAVYDPDQYVIKMIVGWEISEAGLESIRQNSSRTDVDLFISALKEQKEIMFLQFVSHTIDFNENGSVDLSIDYFGRADMNARNLDRANILTVGPAFETLIEQIKNDIKVAEELEKELEKQKETDGFFNEKVEQARRESTKAFLGLTEDKSSKGLKEKLEATIQSSKKAKFNYLATRMLQKKQVHLFSYHEDLIKYITEARGTTDLTSVVKIKDIEDYNAKVNSRNEKIAGIQSTDLTKTDFKTGTVETSSTSTPNLREASAVLQQASDTNGGRVSKNAALMTSIANDQEAAAASNDFFELSVGGQLENASLTGKGRKHFSYFYLSSLIEAVMDPILDTNKKNPNFINKKVRTILGPMTYMDYGSLVDNGKTYKIYDKVEGTTTGGSKIVKVYDGKPTTINIGDIPISYKDFANWFNETIVTKNRDQMTLNDFVSTLVNDLFVNALTSDVYPNTPKQKARVSIEHYTAITSPENERAFKANIGQYTYINAPLGLNNVNSSVQPRGGGFRLSQDALGTLKTQAKHSERDHDPTSKDYIPNKDYMIIYCLSEAPYERVVNYEKDKEDGIMHLYAGDSKGTIRNLKFSRIDNPHRRADNILASTGEGRVISKVIRERYNVNVELFGNTAFQAGTYIFLSPVYPGLGGIQDTQTLLRELGLGGYYLVTEVHNTIEIGDFKTELKAVWSAFGDGLINDGEKEMVKLTPDVIIDGAIVK